MRMQLKTWGTVLELKDSKSKLTETDRIKKITEFIEELSSKKCYVKPKEEKDCSCLSSLQGDVASQDAIASYILYWAQKAPFEQKMMFVEKINGVLLAEKLTNKTFLHTRSTKEGGERVNQSIGLVCRRTKHTNNKDGGKQFGSRGFSSC